MCIYECVFFFFWVVYPCEIQLTIKVLIIITSLLKIVIMIVIAHLYVMHFPVITARWNARV